METLKDNDAVARDSLTHEGWWRADWLRRSVCPPTRSTIGCQVTSLPYIAQNLITKHFLSQHVISHPIVRGIELALA